MNRCRECKQPLGRQSYMSKCYCSERCARLYNLRASKIRRGKIPAQRCSLKADMLKWCHGCPWPCDNCQNVSTPRRCARAISVRHAGKYHERHIVPADCKNCPHGT